jgi:DNA-binding response OmpR family regulator
MRAQILIVEDQAATASLVADILREEDYEVHAVDSLQKARASIERALPDLLVLDRSLPDGDGLDLCRELRAKSRSAALPVLILTARKTVEEKVAGLDGGADDYLAKPFSTQELAARVSALLRRAGKSGEPTVLAAQSIKLDREARKAFVKNKEVPLSAKEFDLLWLLMDRKNRVLTRDDLLQRVWGYESGLDLTTKVVDVTLSHLRDKIGPAADSIVAVRGFGYRFDSD